MPPIASTPLGTPPARAILLLLILVPLGVAVAAISVPVETAEHYLSESGPIEQLSPILWLILAIFSLGLFGLRNLTAWAACILAVAAALRELGMHKSITDDHMLKIGFYFKEEQPIETRLICLLIIAVIATSAAILIVRGWRRFRSLSLRQLPSWAWIMLMAIAVLGISKVFDRSIAILEDTFHFEMHERTSLVIRAIEESTEMLLPIAFGAAMMCLSLTDQHHRQHLENESEHFSPSPSGTGQVKGSTFSTRSTQSQSSSSSTEDD